MSAFAALVRRPVATTLLTLAVALPGFLAFRLLPVASLPQVDMPTISISASLPGASPETMAATVATPLERVLGRIAGITEMTSTSSLGSTRLNLQFELERDIDGAARDVQSAINAARRLLPPTLPSNPTYRKVNAASAPIIAIALTSTTHTRTQMYDVAFNVMAQQISQLRGVGYVAVNGSAQRAVRVEIDARLAEQYGLSLEQISSAIVGSNSSTPRGVVERDARRWLVTVNAPPVAADDFTDLVVAWHNGSPVRLRDIASVVDSVQDTRNAGSAGGQPSVMLAVLSTPGANIVETVDTIRDLLPRLRESIPQGIDVNVVIDRSTSIRASLQEVEHTLFIAIALVMLVVLLFLRDVRATVIPAIAIPVSLLGTLSAIYLCGYSLNNLSLMALIISTGFVVDDAIVVVENIACHMERGFSPMQAAIRGVREVGFTVVAMSTSLVAVFIPLLLMEGIIGRLFREFAVTLAVAVLISLLVSLTTTPMLCARLLRSADARLRAAPGRRAARIDLALGGTIDRLAGAYGRALVAAINHRRIVLGLLAITVAINIYLMIAVPKGFFPTQDVGRLQGFFQADQSISFQAMRQRIAALLRIVAADPAIDTYYEYSGGSAGGQTNTGTMFARLKPRGERDVSTADVAARLRPQLLQIPGAALFLTPQQEFNIGARQSGSLYQFTLLARDSEELGPLATRMRAAMSRLPELSDVTSDYQDRGLQTRLWIDRDAAARLGITAQQIDATLNNAFGQRLISTMFEPLNQYYVVLTLSPRFTAGPDALDDIQLTTAEGRRVPLRSIARHELVNTPLAVNHQGQYVAATISFNLAPGVALGQATEAIDTAFASLGAPSTVTGTFAGTARLFRDSLANQPWLMATALLSVYIVLGVLYESFIHPLTILSTLPSASVGALLALMLWRQDLSIIAMIGLLLVVGIVMKNAIMMIDSALMLQRTQTCGAGDAIHAACMLRFRPIIMTTLAALLGALPLALGSGDGAELRRPLGIAIVGGLMLSQLLTLFTTPVVYIYMDRLRSWRFAAGGAADAT